MLGLDSLISVFCKMFTEYPQFRMFISHSISHITIMPFCFSQNTDTSNRSRYQQACKVITGCKIQPVSRTSANQTHACSQWPGGECRALVFLWNEKRQALPLIYSPVDLAQDLLLATRIDAASVAAAIMCVSIMWNGDCPMPARHPKSSAVNCAAVRHHWEYMHSFASYCSRSPLPVERMYTVAADRLPRPPRSPLCHRTLYCSSFADFFNFVVYNDSIEFRYFLVWYTCFRSRRSPFYFIYIDLNLAQIVALSKKSWLIMCMLVR